MLFDAMPYIVAYVSLFLSIFWFTVYFSHEPKQKRHGYAPAISIIVPAHNEQLTIGKCIKSLIKQKYANLKIIVVDDGSTDNTGYVVKSLKKSHSNIGYLRTNHIGKAAAMNVALRHVRTEVFGFIDADTYLSAGTLHAMVKYFNDETAAVTIAMKPSKAVNLIQRIQKVEYMISSLTRKLLSYLDAVYYTPGFAIYKTDVIKKLGGFDEKNITEDLEIGMRLKDSGYNIENVIDKAAFTEVPQTFRELFRQRMRWYRGYFYNSRKSKHMFFNRKFGDLGIMVLPIQYIVLALITPFLLFAVYDMSVSLLKGIIDLYLTGFDVGYFFETGSFIIVTPMTFFLLALVASFVIMIKISQRETEENVGKLTYLVYIILYPFINTLLWISAFVHEMFGTKKRW